MNRRGFFGAVPALAIGVVGGAAAAGSTVTVWVENRTGRNIRFRREELQKMKMMQTIIMEDAEKA